MKSVLLKESETDHSGNLKCQFLVIRKNIASDKLNDLHERTFLVEDSHDLVSVINEFRGNMLSVPWSQVFQIFAVAGKPLDRREVTGIGKCLVQSPEAADKSFRILCNRFGEVTTLRGNCTDNRYGTFCSVQVLHHSRTLIKCGKLGSQVSRETFLCRHLLQTSGKLTESLSPSGCGICHDGYVIAHIAVIFRKCDTCINRSLTGCNRHV